LLQAILALEPYVCPTRWTFSAATLNSIFRNFAVLREFWEQTRDLSVDSESPARIIGVQAQMSEFSFLFGLMMSERILQHTDNLSRTLQDPNLTAAEGAKIADLTRSTLLKMRSDDNFYLFWARLLKVQEEFEVNEAVQPRKRRSLSRLDDCTAAPEFHSTPKTY